MGKSERLPFLTMPRIKYVSEIPQDESDAKFLTPPSWNFISEGTAEEFNRIVNEYCRTCYECLPKANEHIDHIIEILAKQPSRRKARKHYKPKFTL